MPQIGRKTSKWTPDQPTHHAKTQFARDSSNAGKEREGDQMDPQHSREGSGYGQVPLEKKSIDMVAKSRPWLDGNTITTELCR